MNPPSETVGANRKDQMNFSCVTDLKMLYESCIGREESKAPYDSWIWKGQFNLTSNYVFQDRRAIKNCDTKGKFSYRVLRYWKFYFIYFTCEIFIEIKTMQMIC